jgi:hypothetical protein
MANYLWKPIERLSDGERNIDLADMRPLYENWRAAGRVWLSCWTFRREYVKTDCQIVT